MKILQVNKFFYVKGGSERYFFDVSAAQEQAGHEVIHFSMKHPRNEESPYSTYFIDEIDFQGKKTLKKAVHYMYSKQAADNLRRLIQDHKPDVAHLHNIAHQLTPSILGVFRDAGIPVVQTLHDYQLMCPNYKMYTQGSPCERCKPQKYWNAVAYKCIQNSQASSLLAALEMGFHNILLNSYEKGVDRFIAPSQFMYTKLVEWGWASHQVQHIPHFVEKTRDTSIEKKDQLLFVGRFTQEKGVHTLLAAAEAFPNTKIIFAGEGEERNAMENTIAEKDLNCELVGYKNGTEIDTLMQESQAVVIPSLWYENAPMVVYESLALGTPVIASDIGGLPELIAEGENGFLFAPGDHGALAQAVKKLQKAQPLQISENQYTMESHVDTLFALYDELLHT